MANEISVSLQLRVTNGNYEPGPISVTKQIDQASIGAHAPVQVVGTTEEALSVGDVTTYGILFLRNLDATNFITFGSTLLEWKLKAGEPFFGRLKPGASMYLKADAAAVKVQMLLLQD